MRAPYIELHAHSYYSLLDGAPSPEDLVEKAAAFGMPAMALTDHNALYGAARFWQAATQAGVKPLFGTEITLDDGGGHLTMLAESEVGYANICRLITLARSNCEKGTAALPGHLLSDHADGIIALSGCRRSGVVRAILNRHIDKAVQLAAHYADIFGTGNFFLELQRHHRRYDRRLNAGLTTLGHKLNIPLVATGNVHYLTPDDASLHDVLTCIRHRTSLDQANGLLRCNSEYYFHPPEEMQGLFADWPAALHATQEIADRCSVQLPLGPQKLPTVPIQTGVSTDEYLHHLCQTSLRYKCNRHLSEKYQKALRMELSVIAEQKLANYFLIVWDLVCFARKRGILCQGRGSAANSLVAYLLDITPIDPLDIGLVFERFLSRERATPPDIDLDFDADRREEVIQYLYRKYGSDHVAMACTMVTFRARQAVRDVGLVLGFPSKILDRINASLDEHSATDLPKAESLRVAFGEHVNSPRWRQFLHLAARLDNYPRHLGIHNGGVVLSGPPLADQLPVEPAAMDNRSVVQWDKDSLEAAGWIKLDVLSLRMLSTISDACVLVTTNTGQRVDMNALHFDDPAVYDMIGRGDTIGVFQVESRAQASLIPRFQARCLADLTVQIALIRPGPLQANMVHPYLRRREGSEPVKYTHPLLETVLFETLGVILFQEQVLKVASIVAGFTPGEGELLRRALGHKSTSQQLEAFRDKFLSGALARGIGTKTAEYIFEQLKAFGSYSFSKAHAAAFAVITYWSAWMRCYHPTYFFAGLLRHQPMGFYPPHVIVADAQRSGVMFLPLDLRYSNANVTVERGAIRMGLNYVNGLGPSQIKLIEDERKQRQFASLEDLVERTGMQRTHVEALVLAGALDHLQGSSGKRRQMLWDIASAYSQAHHTPALRTHHSKKDIKLPMMDDDECMISEFAMTGVSLKGHLSTLRKAVFKQQGTHQIGELSRLRHGLRIKVGGIIVTRQRPPTANGMCFLAVEDSSGMVNVVVKPYVYAMHRDGCRSMFAIIEGTLQKENGAINLIAEKVVPV